MSTTMRIKKGDLVQVLAGKDRGKQGRVLVARPRERRVIVENLNLAKRHTKPRPMRDSTRMGGANIIPGGIIDRPMPLDVSNVMLVCPTCKQPTRVGRHRSRTSRASRSACGSASATAAARRSTDGDRDRDESPPRLKQRYEEELRSALQEELALGSVMQVPRISKITLNMGVGEAKTDAKALDAAIEELTTIAGQRAQVRKARKSIASFKLREGMSVGARVTLRGARMYEFLDRLVSIALPRIRDFRGLSPDSFDGRGNYSLGIKEQIIFPEIDYDSVPAIRGLDIAITTTAETDEQGRALLRALGMPFATERRDA